MAESYTTYSQITTHRGCPQRFNYAYVRGLKKIDPEDVKVELEFGNWWHALRAADSIERGSAAGSLQWVPKRLKTVDDGPVIPIHTSIAEMVDLAAEDSLHLVDEVIAQAEQWWRGLPEAVKDQWIERIGADLPTRLTYADEQWHERWKEDLPFEEPLAVEFYWRRDLPTLSDPETGEVADPDTAMLGFIDELFYDTRRGFVVARDHKSSRELGTRSSVDDMMDSQLQIYAWGASPTVTSWGRGPIKSVAYDRMKMVHPRPPSLTSSGNLASRNGEPSIAASDLRTYLEWSAGPDGEGVPWRGAMLPKTAAEKEAEKNGETVERRYKQGGVYRTDPAIVERLSDPAAQSAWFQRTLTPLNRNVVMTHLRASVDSAFDIRRTRFRVSESSEAARNLTRNCKWCPFVELCRAEMTGGPGGDYDLASMRLVAREDS